MPDKIGKIGMLGDTNSRVNLKLRKCTDLTINKMKIKENKQEILNEVNTDILELIKTTNEKLRHSRKKFKRDLQTKVEIAIGMSIGEIGNVSIAN